MQLSSLGTCELTRLALTQVERRWDRLARTCCRSCSPGLRPDLPAALSNEVGTRRFVYARDVQHKDRAPFDEQLAASREGARSIAAAATGHAAHALCLLACVAPATALADTTRGACTMAWLWHVWQRCVAKRP